MASPRVFKKHNHDLFSSSSLLMVIEVTYDGMEIVLSSLRVCVDVLER